MSSSFSKGYELIIHVEEKKQRAYLDLLNRYSVKYVQLPLNTLERPPIDIWFETPESINLGFDLLCKWYKNNKDKDLKIVIREPNGKVIELYDETQILDFMHRKPA